MKKCFVAIAIALFGLISLARADVYIGGHADIGVGFENNNLHLHLHADTALTLYGGGSVPAGEYDPDDLIIGVPTPTAPRPTGSNWDFLATNAGDTVWFLPQSSLSGKPFLGLATKDLNQSGWGNITWTFNSITTVFGANSDFSLYQVDGFGNPTVFASTLVPTLAGNSWTQAPLAHDHYNWAFTAEGIYDVQFTVSAANAGGGTVPAGIYTETATFRFAVGSGIIEAVPEPSALVLTGMSLAGLGWWRRRRD